MTRPRTGGRTPNRRYHHGDLRRALLDQALATIRTDGPAGITLRKIGARLGVSRSALYRHFTDKQALLAAVATEGFRLLRERLVSAWEEGGRGPAAFEAMGAAYVRFATTNPSHYRVMFGGVVDPQAAAGDLQREAAGAFGALVDAIGELQRAGVVRTDDSLVTARFVWAVVHGVAMLGIDGQLREPEAVDGLTRYAIERLGAGLRPDAGERPAPTGRRGLEPGGRAARSARAR